MDERRLTVRAAVRRQRSFNRTHVKRVNALHGHRQLADVRYRRKCL